MFTLPAGWDGTASGNEFAGGAPAVIPAPATAGAEAPAADINPEPQMPQQVDDVSIGLFSNMEVCEHCAGGVVSCSM